jgi:hypothetical protein
MTSEAAVSGQAVVRTKQEFSVDYRAQGSIEQAFTVEATPKDRACHASKHFAKRSGSSKYGLICVGRFDTHVMLLSARILYCAKARFTK